MADLTSSIDWIKSKEWASDVVLNRPLRQLITKMETGDYDILSKMQGITIPVEEVGNITPGDLIYKDSTTGLYERAISDSTEKQNVVGIYQINTNLDLHQIVTRGLFKDETANYSIGKIYYLSTNTGGYLSKDKSNIQIGIALSSTEIYIVIQLNNKFKDVVGVSIDEDNIKNNDFLIYDNNDEQWKNYTLPNYEAADTTIIKEADIGTKVLAPDGDGSRLTGIVKSDDSGNSFLAPDGDGSQLTGILLDADIGTKVLAPDGDGTKLTGILLEEDIGVRVIGMDGDASGLTGVVKTEDINITVLAPDGDGSRLTGIPKVRNYYTKSIDHEMVKNDFVYADTKYGAITLTLPGNPEDKVIVDILDIYGTFFENNVTIQGNGETILGDMSDFILDVNNMRISFMYIDNDWRII